MPSYADADRAGDGQSRSLYRGAGDNFGAGVNDCSGIPTVFDDSAPIAIGAGTAPFAGSFRPESPLAAFNGKPVNGVWVLRVVRFTGAQMSGLLVASRSKSLASGSPVAARRERPRYRPRLRHSNERELPPRQRRARSDETVTVNFRCRTSARAIPNLVATLLPGGGVLAPSGPQTYGVLVPGGPAVARPFTFTVAGFCGGDLTATLALQDGATSLGTATFTIRVGGTVPATSSFLNTTPIIIPETGTGATTGALGRSLPVDHQRLRHYRHGQQGDGELFNLNHTFSPDDTTFCSSGPEGRNCS